MANIISFINAFLSYALLFGTMVVLVVIACIIGVRCRKSKDAKELLEGSVIAEVKSEK